MKYLMMLLAFSLNAEEASILTTAQTQFSFKMYSQLQGEKNLIYSGRSLHELLAMVLAGARGKTAFELERALEVAPLGNKVHSSYAQLHPATKPEEPPPFTLSVINAGWVQRSFPVSAEFQELIKNNYRSEFFAADFIKETEKARKAINTWAEKNTGGKIKKLVTSDTVKKDTRWVLANAVYFKSNWQFPFDKKLTKPDYFFGVKKKRVPFMNQLKEFSYFEDENVRAVTLPYKGNRLSMTLLLSKQKGSEWDADRYRDIKGRMTFQRLRLKMPRFKLQSDLQLKPVLQKMGVQTAFSSEADFSGMTGQKGLSVSEVVQKAFIAVDEFGTEAAAASAVMMFGTAMMEGKIVDAVFDRPFAFVIEDSDSGEPLFMGKVSSP